MDEEARAEEAFVNDAEDKVFNPIIDAATDKAEEKTVLEAADMAIPGAVGSGDLETVVPNEPVNNEASLKNEKSIEGEKITVRKEQKMKPEESVAPATPVQPVAEEAGAQMDDLLKGADEQPTVNENANALVDAKKPAKKKTGMIVGIVLALLLLIGGGIGAVLFFNWHESKDKVAADAFGKLLSVKLEDGKYVSVDDGVGVSKVNGEIVVQNKNVEEYDEELENIELSKITLSVDSQSEAVKGIGKMNVAVVTNDDKEFKFSAEAMYAGDAKLFVKFADLADIKDKVLELVVAEDEDLTETEKSAVTEFYESAIGNIVTAIDGQWAEVSDESLEALLGDKYDNQFSCIMNAYEKASEGSKEQVMSAYKDNAFLSLSDAVKDLDGAESGLTYYQVEVDKEKAKAFAEAIEDIDAAEEITQCINGVEEELESETALNELDSESALVEEGADAEEYFEEEDLDAAEDVTDKVKVYVGIKAWSHEIKNVLVRGDDEDMALNGDFDLDYGTVTVSAPEGAKSLKEFGEGIFDGFKTAAVEHKDGYALQSCSSYKAYASYYENCLTEQRAAVDELNNITFDDFLKEMLGSLEDTDTARVESAL
ncbi:hypothetical protein IIY67_00420 [Candidatus Saccharibacteria bacterium]|nr:hypothetical protein [Candidatus Saccharibacteria bacterium]